MVTMTEVDRLRSLMASGALVHPYLSAAYFSRGQSSNRGGDALSASASASSGQDDWCVRTTDVQDNFVDLAAALSICCGSAKPANTNDGRLSSDDCSFLQNYTTNKNVEEEIQRRRLRLASEIGRGTDMNMDRSGSGNDVYQRRHIVLILCDGMGNSIIDSTSREASSKSKGEGGDAGNKSFFIRNNQPSRLRAVFPSTTPAALTTLATATWPGRHGMPGWNLRDKKGCEFPGNHDTASPPVQLLVLSDQIRDARTGNLASDMGFQSWDKVFVEEPWARKLSSSNEFDSSEAASKATDEGKQSTGRRKMIYVNAYNGDDYQNWSQGGNNSNNKRARTPSDATDFSSWFIGDDNTHINPSKAHQSSQSTLFETAKIEETAFDTLGKPEGSSDAIEFFRQGIDIALRAIANAEKSGDSTFTYLYTAHPDKHMHALGVEHEEVNKVVKGIEREVERFWKELGNKEALLSGKFEGDEYAESTRLDAAVVVTADHGHITVYESDMVTLPSNILELLEYACIGVHGKGRHGYLHCRTGLQSHFRQQWQANSCLSDNFLLLTIEEAIENGLFGPSSMRLKVRPRLGDFVAVSLGRKTLVTPSDVDNFQKQCRCQGAHGSLLPEEMCIPLIMFRPEG